MPDGDSDSVQCSKSRHCFGTRLLWTAASRACLSFPQDEWPVKHLLPTVHHKERPDMMFTSEVEGVMERRILLGRLCEFYGINQFQMRTGGGSQKIQKFCGGPY